MSESPSQPLRLPRQVYRLRVLGMAVGFFSVAAVLREHTAPLASWIAAAIAGFVWPQIAWQRSRRSADPHRTERQNLVADSAIGGAMIALMHFCLLPSVLIAALMSMDKIGWGVRLLATATAAMIGALIVTAALTGFSVEIATSMTVIAWSVPLLVAYPVAVAFVSARSGQLARERRKAIEQSVALREQLAHIARVGTLGEMAAGLAHELNQPLTAIHLEASAALELIGPGDIADTKEALAQIAQQALRAGDIVRRMRGFARRGSPTRQLLDLNQLVREVLVLVDHDVRMAGIEIVTDLGPTARINADRVEIEQVLVNLIRNAIESIVAASAQTRRLTITTTADGHTVRASVSDTGGGLSPEAAARLFHPFHSTKPAGLGLGLSICQTLIEAHGGRVGADNQQTAGATFHFELPLAREVQPA